MISRLIQLAGDSAPAKTLPMAVTVRALESLVLSGVYVMLYPTLQRLFAGTLDTQFIVTITLAIAACYGLRMVLFHISARLIYKSVYTLVGVLRLRLADHLRRVPLGSMQKDYLSRVRSAMTDDLQTVGNLAGSLLGFFVSAIALPLFITAGLALINWKLALALSLSTLCALPVLAALNRFITRHGHDHFQSLSGTSARLIEYVLGIKVLKSYGLTGQRFQQLESALTDTKKKILHLELGAIGLLLAATVVVELGFPVLLLFGTYSVLNGSIDAATVLFSLILAVRFYAPVQDAISLSTEFQYLNTALDRIGHIFDVKTQVEPQSPKTPGDSTIVFENVSFAYGADAPALSGISLTLPEGSMTALVGPSGAGKTTVTNLIARFWDVSSGAITLGGVGIRNLRSEDLMSRIGIVFQDVILFHDSVMENIRMGNPAASDAQVIDAARRACCHDFILRMPEGYQSMVGEGGCRLSGGEKQRISIARALLKDAPIVLLDEATASVDPTAEREIQEAFAALSCNKTVVVIAHKLSTITHADQIVVLDGGQIAETGRHEDLLARNGLYKTLWDNQNAAARWQAAA